MTSIKKNLIETSLTFTIIDDTLTYLVTYLQIITTQNRPIFEPLFHDKQTDYLLNGWSII